MTDQEKIILYDDLIKLKRMKRALQSAILNIDEVELNLLDPNGKKHYDTDILLGFIEDSADECKAIMHTLSV